MCNKVYEGVPDLATIGAWMVRTGSWGILYYIQQKESQGTTLAIIPETLKPDGSTPILRSDCNNSYFLVRMKGHIDGNVSHNDGWTICICVN